MSNVTSLTVLESTLLQQFGQRLRAARKERRLSTATLATQVGVSRTTLTAAEAGSPAVAIGTYVRMLGVLGLAVGMALLANPTVSTAMEPRLEST